jgi:transaldolase
MTDPSLAKLAINKTVFDQLHGQDQMAVDKLKEGIEGFAADQRKLEDMLGKAAAAGKV